jgi:large subunit ribosomal protein L1
MASTPTALAQWSKSIIKLPLRPQSLWICQNCARNQQQIRAATTGTSANAAKYRRNKEKAVAAKKKKQRNTYIYQDLRQAEQFALCDAMR